MATATVFKAVKDRAVGNLNAGVDNSVTTWVLQAGQGTLFPDPSSDGNFWATCDAEQVLCTARTSDTLTVTRAQNGTSGAAHSGAAGVELRVIAQQVADIQDALNDVEARVGDNDVVFLEPLAQTAISALATVSALTDSVGLVGRFAVRERTVIRYWSYKSAGSATANAVVRAAIYSSDGATKLMDDTHAVGAGAGVQTVDLGGGSEVTLEPGDYYFFITLSSGTTGPTVIVWQTGDIDMINQNIPSGQPVFEGTVVVTSGAAPATIDTDSDITGASKSLVFGRLDT